MKKYQKILNHSNINAHTSRILDAPERKKYKYKKPKLVNFIERYIIKKLQQSVEFLFQIIQKKYLIVI